MGLLKTLLMSSGIGAGKKFVPELEYVFNEGEAPPYEAMYDYIGNITPVSIASGLLFTRSNNSRKLVRTSDNILYVVYSRLANGVYQLYVKKSVDDGETWTDETLISTRGGMSDDHQAGAGIAIDSNDNLHVVWEGKATGFTEQAQIWYTKYTDSW